MGYLIPKSFVILFSIFRIFLCTLLKIRALSYICYNYANILIYHDTANRNGEKFDSHEKTMRLQECP